MKYAVGCFVRTCFSWKMSCWPIFGGERCWGRRTGQRVSGEHCCG